MDYLEILTVQSGDNSFYPKPLLVVHCFKAITGIKKDNIVIEGGVRIKNIAAEWVALGTDVASLKADGKVSDSEDAALSDVKGKDNVLVVRASTQGDFSSYELAFVQSTGSPSVPAPGFDKVLYRTEFSFKVECPSDFDCACKETSALEFEEPAIDYMAKDYASFRRLLFDRLSLIAPEWKERNVADMGVALVELLAYVGDHLSYYQDSVGTEAYLGTARRRVSAARHARLLDYFVQDGCNARAWVCIGVSSTTEMAKKSVLLTGSDTDGPVTRGDDLEKEVNAGAEVFETMHDITLYESKNEIEFYTWDETDCWLPKGATSTTIRNTLETDEVFVWEDIPEGTGVSGDHVEELAEFLEDNFLLDWLELAIVSRAGNEITITNGDDSLSLTLGSGDVTLYINGEKTYEFEVEEDSSRHIILASCLRVGDVLVLEETESPSADSPPDPSHRHAVRLSSITMSTDDLTGAKVMEIGWGQGDALPFALCLAKADKQMSIVRGNVVLADHGYTRSDELELATVGGTYYPALERKPLTRSGPGFDTAQRSSASAASAFSYQAGAVKPAVELAREGETWSPQRDLLSSDEFANEFAVETEMDGTAYIRFPNSEREDWVKDVESGTLEPFTAAYRVGNGEKGNVGPYSIRRLFSTITGAYGNVKEVFNPMAAAGGRDPETLSSIRLHAPQAFRRQERAVTESDYVDVLKKHPHVQHAVATKRWTGSWYTMFVTIDRKDGLEVDSEFEEDIIAFLEKYRMAGYDVEVNGPVYVPLKIAMCICLKDGYYEGEVKEKLLEVFSAQVLVDGSYGFFHPDNFTFGQALYLSKLYEAAMAVEGVSSVEVTTLQRWGKVKGTELEDGLVRTDALEVIRLDNNPSKAENGMIEIKVCGEMQ